MTPGAYTLKGEPNIELRWSFFACFLGKNREVLSSETLFHRSPLGVSQTHDWGRMCPTCSVDLASWQMQQIIWVHVDMCLTQSLDAGMT